MKQFMWMVMFSRHSSYFNFGHEPISKGQLAWTEILIIWLSPLTIYQNYCTLFILLFTLLLLGGRAVNTYLSSAQEMVEHCIKFVYNPLFLLQLCYPTEREIELLYKYKCHSHCLQQDLTSPTFWRMGINTYHRV